MNAEESAPPVSDQAPRRRVPKRNPAVHAYGGEGGPVRGEIQALSALLVEVGFGQQVATDSVPPREAAPLGAQHQQPSVR